MFHELRSNSFAVVKNVWQVKHVYSVLDQSVGPRNNRLENKSHSVSQVLHRYSKPVGIVLQPCSCQITTTLTRLPRESFHFKNPSSATRVQRFVMPCSFGRQLVPRVDAKPFVVTQHLKSSCRNALFHVPDGITKIMRHIARHEDKVVGGVL